MTVIKQTVIELCDNCYNRFWAFREPVLFCIVCGDLHGFELEVKVNES